MTNQLFDIPQEFLNTMGSLMQPEGVRLPFYAPVVWWKNGSNMYKAVGGVQYFGGWAVSAEDMEKAPNGPIPGFEKENWVNREGGDYTVYASRSIGFAPIARRKQWTQNDQGNWRSHVQILGMAASATDHTFTPFGPVVLSAKGISSKTLEDALLSFDKATHSVRSQVAPGAGYNFFYCRLGTFGGQPEMVPAGKGQTTLITPIRAFIPAQILPDHLKAWYLGMEVIPSAISYGAEAKEWLDAWKENKEQAKEADPFPSF